MRFTKLCRQDRARRPLYGPLVSAVNGHDTTNVPTLVAGSILSSCFRYGVSVSAPVATRLNHSVRAVDSREVHVRKAHRPAMTRGHDAS